VAHTFKGYLRRGDELTSSSTFKGCLCGWVEDSFLPPLLITTYLPTRLSHREDPQREEGEMSLPTWESSRELGQLKAP
jgi:hypothetical protein